MLRKLGDPQHTNLQVDPRNHRLFARFSLKWIPMNLSSPVEVYRIAELELIWTTQAKL